MRKWTRMLILFLLLTLLPGIPALAEDVCTVKDAMTASCITTDRAYLRLQCELADECPVTVTVRDAWGTLVYQRDYGVRHGAFRSSDIHLPLEGESCEYRVSLCAGDTQNTFTVIREMAMISDTAVYAGGLTLKDMVDGSRRKYAVVLDMDALNEETAIVPMLASGMQVGEVYFSVLDGVLTVDALLTAEGSIDKATVYIAPDAITASTLGSNRFTGVKSKLAQEIDLGDTPYAAVMVQLTVTYDPATAQIFEIGEAEEEALEEQQHAWELMQLTTANEAVG